MINEKPYFKSIIGGAVLLVLVLAFFSINQRKQNSPQQPETKNEPEIKQISKVRLAGDIKKFENEQQLKDYLQESQAVQSYFGGFGSASPMTQTITGKNMALDSVMPNAAQGETGRGGGGAEPERFSQTNVQVSGVDEPDLLKTDGKSLFYSKEGYYYPAIYREEPMMDFKEIPGLIMPPPNPPQFETQIISALPVADAQVVSKLNKNGQLLLSGSWLVVINNNLLTGYDVSDNKNPKEKWQITLNDNAQFVAARLFEGKIYLVTQRYPELNKPCPIPILKKGDTQVEIACSDIYRPPVMVPQANLISVLKISPNSGDVESKTSFLGSGYESVVYQSAQNLYVTYNYNADQLELMVDFFKNEGKGILPLDLVSRLEKISAYDLSNRAKLAEMEDIMQRYQLSLSQDDATKLQNDTQNKMQDFSKRQKRAFTSTGIIKLDAKTLQVIASGAVPGRLLNQFSLDEYEGNLRVAVTVGESFFFGNNSQTANDVYVLDKGLKIIGQVTDLGLSERIYSVRFAGKMGYAVTFRQTDPFYTLDLSNPKNPQKKGELKIPGFSSYLHPLTENLILGVGQEDGRVKLSLFDVSNSQDPKEADKYLMDSNWTDVSGNHHAFLQDEKHKIFFMPANNNGFVFSYEGGKLELKKAVSGLVANRAAYINDYLYVLGTDKMVVLDQKTWERVKEINFK